MREADPTVARLPGPQAEGRVEPLLSRRASELAGRHEELALLRSALERARAGRSQVVLIQGEPGMGKSALLNAFLSELDDRDVLRLSGDEFEADLAFGAIDVLLDQPTPTGSDVEAGRRLLSFISDAQGSGNGVTVLAIDDAQWLDRPSAQALRFALRRLRHDRVLAVIARRPGPVKESGLLDATAATSLLRTAPLDADGVRELAWHLRSWDLPRSVAEQLAQRTGGMPLLLGAVLRGADHSTQLESRADVPATAAAAATRLLSSVPRPTQLLVEASAVLAEPTDLVVLGRLANVEDPHAAVAPAVSAGLLRLGPEDSVDCAHDLLREAVYLAIPLDARRDLHTQAARWTTGDRRLAHRAAAAARPDPQLAAELVRAADESRADLRYDLAASQRLRARSVAGDPERRDGLLLEALVDRVASGDLAGATELADAAERLSPSALRSLALGLLARESGRIGEARTLLSDALTQARASSRQAMEQRAGIAAAMLYVRINENQAAIEAIGDADQTSDPEVAGDARTTKAIGLWQAGDSSAALTLLNGVQLSQRGAPWEADLLAVRAAVHMYAGQLPLALADLNRTVGLAHLWRPSTYQSRIYVMRSSTRFWLGDWDGAAVDAASARALAEGLAESWTVPLASAVSADVPANRGQWAVAAEHLRVATEALGTRQPSPAADSVDAHQVDLMLAQQDYSGVRALLQPMRSEEYLGRLAAYRPYRWVMPGWILACIGLGRHAEAEESIADYRAMLDRWPGGPTPIRLGWLRGLLAEGRGVPRAAREHYAEDLQDPVLSQVPFAHAQVLYAAGRLERVLGNRRGAVEYLAQAQAIFATLRAQPDLERCVAELNACGLRSTVTSPLGLTGREEDVAGLVARGYTNKEVGSELFLTAKAVEYHLRNIYAKLGVTNRQELRRLRAVS
ncbi:MAG: AAA family ATPase [Propionibacteriaceae bacterium]